MDRVDVRASDRQRRWCERKVLATPCINKFIEGKDVEKRLTGARPILSFLNLDGKPEADQAPLPLPSCFADEDVTEIPDAEPEPAAPEPEVARVIEAGATEDGNEAVRECPVAAGRMKRSAMEEEPPPVGERGMQS